MEKKRKRKMRRIININSKLPLDIIELIFSKVHFVNLPACRLVCKAWNNLILTCKFVPPIPNPNAFFAHISPYQKLHLVDLDAKNLEGEGMSIVASFNFPPNWSEIAIVSSCNGLVCFIKRSTIKRRSGPRVGILNPMTNEYITLPRGDKGVFYYYGFGFSPKTKQYKVTRHSFIAQNRTTLVEIFAFGTVTSRQWSRVASVPLRMDFHGVYFNGALYWVGRRNFICRLDLEDEKFEQIPFPQNINIDIDYCLCLPMGVFNGGLYLSLYNIQSFEYHVWKMEESCRREEDSSSACSWTTAFVVALPPNFANPRQFRETFHLHLIKPCEEGKILCLLHGVHLILYDPKIGRMETLLHQNQPLKKNLWIFHVDSFNFHSLHNILAGEP